MTTTQASKAFYTKTTLIQDGITFEAMNDFHCVIAGAPTQEETINHLASTIEDGCFEVVSGEGSHIKLNGLTPYQFASALVINEEACKGNGNEWEVYTKWEESDPENWENPLS